MRYLVGLGCVLAALGVVHLVGCGETAGTGGSGGNGGQGGDGGGVAACADNVCPCTEAGIRAAIEVGGDDPYTFDCDGPQSVNLQGEIVIDNDVILDGEGNLTVVGYGHYPQRVFSVPEGVTAELRRLTATGGYGGIANEGTLAIQDCVISANYAEFGDPWAGGGIFNEGEMTIIDSTVSGNRHDHGSGGGIYNGCSATLTLANSTVSDNFASVDGWGAIGGGICNVGEMTIINSTVSGNSIAGLGEVLGGGIANGGWMSLTNSTVSGNDADSGDAIAIDPSSCGDLYIEIANTLIGGDCEDTGDGSNQTWVSRGYNIESPGDTCGLDQQTDMPGMSADDLKLGELADNGGPTKTHALLPGSEAINKIPAEDCEVDEDQRGQPRPAGTTDPKLCDVAAFELQP